MCHLSADLLYTPSGEHTPGQYIIFINTNRKLCISFQCVYDAWLVTSYATRQRVGLNGIVHQFSIYNIFFVSQQKNFFYKMPISIKQLWLGDNWVNRVLKVSPTENCYINIIYITRTYFEHHFSQLSWVRIILSRWTFHKYVSFSVARKKCYILKIGGQSL